jgi:O-antigen ligase
VKTARWNSILAALQKIFWVLFLITLPWTSFPYFPPAIGGGTLVRPLSIYPLIALLILVTLPRLFTRPLPKSLLPLFVFAMLAVASSLLSLLKGIDPALGIPVTERVFRALVTLGIGGAVYLTVALMPRTLEDLRSTLRWIYAGFAIALLWGTVQAFYIIHFDPVYFHIVNKIQGYITIRHLFTNRASGLTYEPNWFAEQISLLLIPWLLASVFSGYSVFRWRWHRVTPEWFLLGWAIVVLPFTFSRAGLANLVVLAFLGILFFRFQSSQKPSEKPRTGQLTRRLIEAGLILAVLGGLFYFAGTKNEFFSRIWGYWLKNKNLSISGYLDYLGFGARFTYGETAFRTYEAFPVMGVGLGNYAFYFDEMLPNQPLAYTPEVIRLVTPEAGRDRLITPKNLYLRLLAETGLVGTAAFVAFLIAMLGCALYLWKTPKLEGTYWGTSGLLALIAFAVAAFSFDSFAIPNMWVIFGLITAATGVLSAPQTPPHAQNVMREETNIS